METKNRCPKWGKFINEVLGAYDQRRIKLECRYHSMIDTRMIFRGAGANGKSLAERIIKKALNIDEDDKFIRTTNDMKTRFSNRYCVIDFTQIVSERHQNPNLYSELLTELPAIKEWLLS
jgi:phage/plasmid-associated DNA primase